MVVIMRVEDALSGGPKDATVALRGELGGQAEERRTSKDLGIPFPQQEC